MKIGAHVHAAGGPGNAIDRALEIGAETIQIFPSAPQTWRYKEQPEPVASAFRERVSAAKIGPVFFHGIYLINLAASTPEHLAKSIDSLCFYQRTAARMGAVGTIFHIGSHKGAGLDEMFPQIVTAIGEVLAASPAEPWLILENSAGMGQSVGSRFSELGRIIAAVADPRLKVCLDTAHAFAAGYNIADPDGVERTMEEFDREIGLANLVAVHANDSKVPLGAGVDRHENIGQGHIGLQGFEVIMRHPAFADVPFLLEVPGFDNKGPDAENVTILKQLRDKNLASVKPRLGEEA
jgi:deoxyribonuclease-4